MTHWEIIIPALILSVIFIVWPAIQARSIGTLIRNSTITLLVFVGVPLALCAAVISLPFLALLFARNSFIQLISKNFYKNLGRHYVDEPNRITHKKLNVYGSYAGSMDVFLRSGTTEDKALLTDSEWVLIDDYIHNIWLARCGQLSEPLIEKLETSIFNDCASISVVVKLKRMNWENYRANHKKGIFNKFLNWLFP
jgi:hypothetical protein